MTLNKRKKIYFGIFWIILITSFIFFAVLLILMANGYHLNWKIMKLQQTGMIIINGNLDNIKLKNNNTEKTVNLPYRANRLLPGRYEIIITKDKYQNWSKVFNLEGGKAIIVNNLVLFYEKPEIKKIDTSEKALNQLKKDFESRKDNLKISGSELYKDNNLVTRFSQPILGAIYDENSNRIYLQTTNELRVIEIDGANNRLLASLKQVEPTTFSINKNIIQFVDQSEIYEAIVR